MRSLAEIRFRLRQELAGVMLAMFPPAPSLPSPVRLHPLPDPESIGSRLRGSVLAGELEMLAGEILAGRIPLLGHVLDASSGIRWRRDFLRRIETPAVYFRRIPYLDAARSGDHKVIWELNRHQHLVVLAQAWLLSGRSELLEELQRQLISWFEQNPFCRGINWTSALEVAFRALSWIWICHLCGTGLSIRGRLLTELYRHGLFLEYNLSVYFSPNTHLLGEAVALHALGVLFPDWPRAARWRDLASATIAAQMDFQVRSDGSHFEQSSAYHIYAVDFFLFHALLEPVGERYLQSLGRMADYLAALCDDQQCIPLLGDDDGGRLFHPYGPRRRFAAPTLASCAVFLNRSDLPCAASDLEPQAVWWIGPGVAPPAPPAPAAPATRLFDGAGVVVFSQSPVQLIADTRAFGFGGAGHSHAHALTIVCRRSGQDVLLDPGTYTYVDDPAARDLFRGTASHNTVRIGGRDQATPAGPFRWAALPETSIVEFRSTPALVYLHARCASRGVLHSRHITWLPEDLCFAVFDLVTGPGEQLVEQFWHSAECSPIGPGTFALAGGARLSLHGGPLTSTIADSWQSEVPGRREPRKALIASVAGSLPCLIAALFRLDPDKAVRLDFNPAGIRLTAPSADCLFRRDGDAIVPAGGSFAVVPEAFDRSGESRRQ